MEGAYAIIGGGGAIRSSAQVCGTCACADRLTRPVDSLTRTSAQSSPLACTMSAWRSMRSEACAVSIVAR